MATGHTISRELLFLVPVQRRAIKLKQLQLANLKAKTFEFELPVTDAESRVQTSPDPDGRMINAIAKLDEMTEKADAFIVRSLKYIDTMRDLVQVLDPVYTEILEERFFDADFALSAEKTGRRLNFSRYTIERYCAIAYKELDEYLKDHPEVLNTLQNLM